ncbi:MAG TPA: hypothetical protein VER96_32215 [Polyangiaceae bacterium]|nr:hypothetical protein [Polyangiaceae bacterium]
MLYRDPQHVLAVYQNTILTYSGDAPNPEYLDGWARTVEQLSTRFPTGLLVMTIARSLRGQLRGSAATG